MGNSILNSDFGGHNLTDTPVAFLSIIRPPPWTLVAIERVRNPRIETRTFGDPAEAEEWIAGWDKVRNLYTHVNRLWPGDHRSKGNREAIAAMEFYHADVDVKPPTEDALAAKLAQIQSYSPAPSLIVASGGGFNCWYRLATPIFAPAGSRLDGDLWRDLERRNYQLEHDLSEHPDGTWDACRILRIAGTWNCLSDVKRAAKRTECRAETWVSNDSTFTPDQFREAPKGSTAGKRAGKVVDLPTDLPAVNVNSLPLDGRWKSIIIQGYDLLNPKRYKSARSGTVFAVTMAMCRAGIDDVTIASVLLDPRNGISEHVLEQTNRRAYVKRQIANARGRINDHRS